MSWGYAIKVFDQHHLLPDALPVDITFREFEQGKEYSEVYSFNTRKVHPDPCARPTVFFLHSISSRGGGIKSVYRKVHNNCTYDAGSSKRLNEIRVFSHKLDLDRKQVGASNNIENVSGNKYFGNKANALFLYSAADTKEELL